MVHKKSEYRLQFHQLSNEIRSQIWRENITFRETQKRMNLSDHYWRYQLIDDPCDCENGSDTGLIDTGSKRSDNVAAGSIAVISPRASHDKEVQTEWQDSIKESFFPEKKEETKLEKNTNISVVEEPTFAVEPNKSNIKASIDCKPESSKFYLSTGNERVDLQSSEIYQKDRISSYLNPSPTRNSRKLYHSDIKTTPVFAAFGWNDTDKNVGDQKTFNVRAPVHQVHHSALQASGKRLKDLELYFAEQLRKSRLRKSLPTMAPPNLSSIWMTEYQECFSKGDREPLARVSSRRPIVWRYS